MAEVEIDGPLFWSRLRRTVNTWQEKPELFNNAHTLCIAVGKDDDARPDNLRITSVQLYLLGYEFPETILMFRKEKLQIWSSQKRCDILAPLIEGRPEDLAYSLELVPCAYKEPETNKEKFEGLLVELADASAAAEGGPTPVGVLLKETKYQIGVFSKTLLDMTIAAQEAGRFTVADIGTGFGEVFSVKDDTEIGNIRRSATFSASVYKKFTVAEVEKVIDNNKEIKQSKLGLMTENVINEPKKKFNSVSDEFAQSVEMCYPPVVQSGGNYDLANLYSCRAETSDDILKFDTIVLSLGTKYKSYCSNIARTLMVDTPPTQESCYTVLESAYKHLLKSLVPGVTFADVYASVVKHIEETATAEEQKQLVGKLMPRLGYGIGLGVRDLYLEITATNTRKVQANMTLAVMVGFKEVNVEHNDTARKTVSMVVSDTVLVVADKRDDDTHVELLTKSASNFQNVSYTVTEDEDQEGESSTEDEGEKAEKWKASLRHNKGQVKSNADARDQQQRKILEMKRSESGNRRRTKQDEKKDFSTAGRLARGQLNSYATEKEMPEVKGLYLDKPQDTLLIPLWGTLAPFHISTVRNVSKSEEGDAIYLRFNFHFPSGGANAYVPGIMFPQCTFIKELTYRVHSKQAMKATAILNEVTAAIKRVKSYDARQKESEGLIKQDVLRIDRSVACPKLREVHMRPSKGRKVPGTLEGYKDGVRFVGAGESTDILFSNVKHGIVHPANNDVICLVHFHLKNHIMVGTKKTLDVQFYTEVMDDEKLQGHNMRRTTEDQEIEEENRQRSLIARLNSEFVTWGQRMQSVANFRFETPFYKSDFTGTVNRNTQVIRKTNNCLISLVEGPPFFVLTLEDVEICVLERVILGHKNFDIVFVPKDYKLGVTRIDTVDMQKLDEMKDWLTGVKIIYYEVPQPLAWAPIMKEVISSDSKEEWEPWSEEDGWSSFLDVNQADPDDSDTDSADSEFDDGGASESSSDYSGSDSEGDTTDDSDADEEEEDEEEESGTDWDEMEDRLGKEDREKNVSGSDDSDADSDDSAAPKRKGPKPGSKPSKPAARPPPPRPGQEIGRAHV